MSEPSSDTVLAHKCWVMFECRPSLGNQPFIRSDKHADQPTTARNGPGLVSTALSSANSVATGNRPTPSPNPLWSADNISVSHDLSPTLLSALGATSETNEQRLFPVYRATRLLLAALNGAQSTSGTDGQVGLTIQLGKKTDQTFASLFIDDAFVVHFDSGLKVRPTNQTSLLVLRLGLLAKLSPTIVTSQVLHVLHVLSHDSRKPSLRWFPTMDPFRLSDLAHGLLEPLGLELRKNSRLFTYCYAKLPDGADTSTGAYLSFRMARHYDENYRLEDVKVLQPFENVWHATEFEGASTVAAGEIGLFAVKDPANAVQATYLPQVIAAYYEHVILLRLANSAVASAGADQRESLRRLQEEHLMFRLRNSLPVVSQLSLHNAFYGALCLSLEIPLLSRKVSEDVAAAARLLETRHLARAEISAHRRERRAAVLQGLLSGAVGFLTCLALIRELAEMSEKFAHGDIPIWRSTALISAVIVALLLAWFAALRHRFEYGGGGRADPKREAEEFREATNTALEAGAVSSERH